MSVGGVVPTETSSNACMSSATWSRLLRSMRAVTYNTCITACSCASARSRARVFCCSCCSRVCCLRCCSAWMRFTISSAGTISPLSVRMRPVPPPASALRSCMISCWYCCSSVDSSATSFCDTRFTTFFARNANLRLPRVSEMLVLDGDMVTMTAVLALPPRDMDSKRVSFDSRYGTWESVPAASLEITVPSVTSDLLMYVPSFKCTPLTPDLPTRSLPARSTRFSTDTRTGCVARVPMRVRGVSVPLRGVAPVQNTLDPWSPPGVARGDDGRKGDGASRSASSCTLRTLAASVSAPAALRSNASSSPAATRRDSMTSRNNEWDRDECAFMSVSATCLRNTTQLLVRHRAPGP